MNKLLITRASAEPVSLAEAKAHLVVEHPGDDRLIRNAIAAARAHIEIRCNIKIVRQMWRVYFDSGLRDFDLAISPVQEISSIQYINQAGEMEIVGPEIYNLDVPGGVVYTAHGQTWPSARGDRNSAAADVWAGYYRTDSSPINVTADIPDDLKSAMLLLIEDMYSHRGKNSEINLINNPTYEALLGPHVNYADG